MLPPVDLLLPHDPEIPELSRLEAAALHNAHIDTEQHFLSRPEELDLSLRAWAARGGLITAAVLYIAGLFSLGVFVGVFEHWPAASSDKWHIVVTTVVALFSVPTMILLTIIRSSSPVKAGPDPASRNLHALIGEKLLNLLEKLADKVIARN